MQVGYGGYSFPANGVRWTTETTTELVDNVPTVLTVVVSLEGKIEGTSTSQTGINCATMQRAIQTPYQDLVLRDNNGQVLEAIRSAGSISGVFCSSGPNYTDGVGADYGLYRNFSAQFRAISQVEPGKPLILNYVQSLAFGGGSPTTVFQPSINGKWVKVQTSPGSTYKAKQSGSAVGLIGYPPVPKPIFGVGNLAGSPEISYTTPKRNGRGYTEYPVTWSYEFESVNPMVGLPGLPL